MQYRVVVDLLKIFFAALFSVSALGFGQPFQPSSKERKMVQAPPPVLPKKEESASPFFGKSSSIQVGVSGSYAYVAPTGYSPTQGVLVGLRASYEYQKPDFVYGGLFVNWREGNTHGFGKSRDIVDVSIEEKIGYTWGSFRSEKFVSLFTGFGARSLQDFVKVHSNSLTFAYLEWYFPIGFTSRFLLLPDWSLGALVQWMPQIYPTVAISPLKGARWTLNSELLNFLIRLPIEYQCSSSPSIFFVLEPFAEIWNDGHTSAETEDGIILHVPSNRYVFAGLHINVRFAF